MTDRRRIEYTTTMDQRGFAAGASKMMDSLTNLGKKFGISESVMQTAAGAASGFVAALGAQKVVQFASDGIQLASAAAEIDQKFQAVFGSAKELTDALEAWGDMAGVTEADAKNLAATFGNLAQAQGITADESKALALKVAQLAGDMASFNDQDPSVVFNDLNKALLTSEREGMKKYGIAISEVEVKTRAAAIAAADGRTEVTKADRAYASYAIAVDQAGKAVGDLERTQDSAANQQRQLKASFVELQTEIGENLLPTFAELVRLGNDLMPVLKALNGNVNENSSALEKAASKAKQAAEWLSPLKIVMIGLNGAFGDNTEVVEEAVVAQNAYNEALAGATGDAQALEELYQKQAKSLAAVTQQQKEYRDAIIAGHSPLSETVNLVRDYGLLLDQLMGRRMNWGALVPPGNPYADGSYNPERAGKSTSDNTARFNAINGGPS